MNKYLKITAKSKALNEMLHKMSNTDVGPLGGASDKLRSTDKFRKLKSDAHKAFQAERAFNSSPEGKKHQANMRKMSIVERQQWRRKNGLGR